MTTYSQAILEGFQHLLRNHDDVFVLGQGVWSPWYVGDTMTGLEQEFGVDRVIDSPVSELATTGAALGAALCGYRPIVIHPRVDFTLLALDQVVNQAAKWSSMFGGTTTAPVTYRCIINRGGEQGAQHSQSLTAWFAHIPGLRVVTPATPGDARDLLVASVLCPDPVIYMDDRWLYDQEADLPDIVETELRTMGPTRLVEGDDITLVGSGYSTQLCMQAARDLASLGVSAAVIDLRIVNPIDADLIVESVSLTQRLCVVDGDWSPCGLAGEIIALVAEQFSGVWRSRPRRITLPFAPAPTSRSLEDGYYTSADAVTSAILTMMEEIV